MEKDEESADTDTEISSDNAEENKIPVSDEGSNVSDLDNIFL
jgi:hypothetical protein